MSNIEMLQYDEQKREAYYKKLKDTITFFDPKHPRTENVGTYKREALRTYLKNPAQDSNNKNLRKLSEYLYTVSYVYRRMINFKAHQINCKTWNAYPILDMVGQNNTQKVLKDYQRAVDIVRNMKMENQILKIMLKAWKAGVAYGYLYGNPEKDGEFYIHLLDNDYCKISQVSYDSGVIGFMYDMSYFATREEDLNFYDKEFSKLYREYQKDKEKWKQLPLDSTICIKIDTDNLLYSIPPLSGLLEQIISLTDLQAAQDEIDKLQNYKMIWGKVDTLSGTKSPNDFEVDLDLALAFMNKIGYDLPNNVGYGVSPLDLNTIEFKDNDASDSNVLSKAYSNVIESNGSIVLNSNRITNSASFKLAMKAECLDAMAPVTQINAWLNFYLKNNYNIENIIVEYSDISPYFIDDEIEKFTKAAGLSLPVKTQLASMLGYNPQAQYGFDFLEREVLKLGTERWNNPLVSSAVQSGIPSEDAGAPQKDESDLSDEGQATRDKQ